MTKLPPELFTSGPPVRSDFARLRPRRYGRFIVILILMIGIAMTLIYLPVMHAPKDPSQIPTIKAEGPYREKPQQPGGLEIPHQDVELYEVLENKNGTKSPVEHLLPPPEMPKNLSGAVSSNPETNAAPQPQTQSASKVETMPVVEAPQHRDIMVIEPQAAQPLPEAKPVLTPEIKPTPIKPQANDKDMVRLQLASIPDAAEAEREKTRLKTKFLSLLGDTSLSLIKADLGKRGMTYRVQSGLMSRNAAESICAAIKKQNAGCILVKK